MQENQNQILIENGNNIHKFKENHVNSNEKFIKPNVTKSLSCTIINELVDRSSYDDSDSNEKNKFNKFIEKAIHWSLVNGEPILYFFIFAENFLFGVRNFHLKNKNNNFY